MASIFADKDFKSRNNEKNFNKTGNDFVLGGIISRIRTYLDELHVRLDEKAESKINNFLVTNVDGRVWVMVDSDMPVSDEYEYMSIRVQNCILKLAYGADVADGKFPNILYISAERSPELAFRKFWLENYLPLILLEEILVLLDLSKHITVLAYERASLWRQALSTAKDVTIIGQTMDPETGYFNERRPIGYVSGNMIVITSPNERLDYMGNTYEFN